MNGLDLFSGIGGIGIALEPWVRTVAYCERDRYAQGVLLSRMRSGDIDQAPIWDDVTTLRADLLPRIDIIFGGFPCQDLSVAGAGKGLAGERSGLFFEIVRLARECRPRFLFLENVPAIRTRGGETVVKELAKIGYDCRWTTLSAAAVGAPHKRDRWFLLAHSQRERCGAGTDELGNGSERGASVSVSDSGKASRVVADSTSRGFKGVSDWDTESNHAFPQSSKVADSMCDGLSSSEVRQSIGKSNDRNQTWQNWSTIPERRSEIMGIEQSSEVADSSRAGCQELDTSPKSSGAGYRSGGFDSVGDSTRWATEPDVGRVAHGIPNRVDRIRCLGNSVVPLQVRQAFQKLAGI